MDPIIEIKNNRYGYLIPLPFIWALMLVFYWAWQNPSIDLRHSTSLIWKIVPFFVWVMGTLVTLLLWRDFLNPLIIFAANSEGFKANYNGKKTGVILWKDVKETREMQILTSKATRSTNYEIVIAVFLKDPESYTAGKNLLMRTVIQSMVNNYGTSIFVYKVSMSDSDYQKIKILMEDAVMKFHEARP